MVIPSAIQSHYNLLLLLKSHEDMTSQRGKVYREVDRGAIFSLNPEGSN